MGSLLMFDYRASERFDRARCWLLAVGLELSLLARKREETTRKEGEKVLIFLNF